MAVEVRTFRDEDREAAFHVRVTAFRHDRPDYDASGDADYTEDERRLVAVDAGTVVGHLGVWELAQWFGGRAVPCGGVASVAILPSHRRRGIASALLQRAVADMRERGENLSMLYPMAFAPYRNAGWEVGGVWLQREVPTRALATLPRPDHPHDIVPVTEDHLEAMTELHDEASRRHAGNLRRGARMTQRFLAPDEDTADYVVLRGRRVVGYVTYGHEPTDEPGASYRLRVHELVGVDRDAELAAWHVVASSSSAAFTTRFVSRPDEPLLLWLPEGSDLRAVPFEHPWMSRLVDAPQAVAGRGFRPDQTAVVHLRLRDPLVPDNDGAFVLDVDRGEAALTPGGAGTVELDIGAFASLYTGWASAWTLAHAGRLTGGHARDLDALTDLFSGPLPWSRNYF